MNKAMYNKINKIALLGKHKSARLVCGQKYTSDDAVKLLGNVATSYMNYRISKNIGTLALLNLHTHITRARLYMIIARFC
jgi:hypothetical protein